MKKIILSLVITIQLLSCREETQEKVKEATKAVSTDVEAATKIAKEKALKVIDSSKLKEKAKVIIAKGADKIEKGAKKVKEATEKNK
ncbi:hypothetical protein GCM10011508_00350 [Flavobacterium lutivivi]|jgi:hypothetical protein|nr:hypothetical protein GCM10011508_00350 [Flavobacterium lutivivi]